MDVQVNKFERRMRLSSLLSIPIRRAHFRQVKNRGKKNQQVLFFRYILYTVFTHRLAFPL